MTTRRASPRTLFWIGILAVAVALLSCWRFLLLDRLIPFDGNMVTLYFPNWAFGRGMLAAGHWPLWNPLRDMGEPFWADPQTISAYPPFWILSPLRDFRTWLIFWYVGHSALAAASFAMLAYRYDPRPLVAGTAAILGSMNGFFLSHLSPNVFASAAWVPLAIVCALGGTPWGAGIVLAMQWLAGFPDFSVLTVGVVSGIYLLRGREGCKRLVETGGITLGLSFFQFLPFLEYFAHSVRPLVIPLAEAGQFSVQPRELMRMLWIPQWTRFVPQLSGDPAVMAFYIGLPALFAALFGLLRGGRRERLWGGGFVLCLALATGNYFPGFRHLRFLHVFCYPAHWLLLATVCAVLLAAAGAGRLRSDKGKVVLLATVTLDLVAFAQVPRVAWMDPAFLTQPPALALHLLGKPYPTRTYHSNLFLAAWQRQEMRSVDDLRRFGEYLAPSYGMAFGVGDVHSHQALLLRRTADFLDRLQTAGPRSTLLGDAGISTVVTLAQNGREVADARVVELPLPQPSLFIAPDSRYKEARLSNVRLRPGAAQAAAEVYGKRRLVLNQVVCPGWEARVDGRRVPLLAYLDTFMSVDLPPGIHEIIFEYRPLTVIIGVVVSLSTVFLGVGYGFARRRSRSASPPISVHVYGS